VDAENAAAITVYGNIRFDIIEQLGSEIEMQLSLEDPVVQRVQRPPGNGTTENALYTLS